MSYPKSILFSSKEKEEEDLCLVIIPFSKAFDGVYECIKMSLENDSVNMRCVRADEMNDTKSVMEDIIELVKKAHIIIADVTGLNANVLYELGICHSVKDKVILLTQDTDSLPFDFRHLRAIEYKTGINDGFKLVNTLKTTINNIKSKPVTPFPSIQNCETSPKDTEIEIVHGPKICLSKLVEELKKTREKHGDQTAIIRALPVEFTKEIFGNRIDKQTINSLQEYKDFIKYIVLEGSVGVDNWDYTVYGRVYDDKLNQATIDFINDVYFGSHELPDTSEIGVDETWNHVGFFVLGKTNAGISEFVPDSTFIIYGEPISLRPDSGCLIKNTEFATLIVKRWYETLKHNSSQKNMYWNMINDTKDIDSVEKMKNKISETIMRG